MSQTSFPGPSRISSQGQISISVAFKICHRLDLEWGSFVVRSYSNNTRFTLKLFHLFYYLNCSLKTICQSSAQPLNGTPLSRLLNFGLDPLGKSGDVGVYTIVPPSATPAPASSAHEVPAVVLLFTHQRTCRINFKK